MESLLITINIILAVILVISVLLQKSEGGALGLGVSQDNFTTARTMGSFLTKFTSIIATLFILIISTRSFGGITGDVLGSTNELTRLASLMVFVSI